MIRATVAVVMALWAGMLPAQEAASTGTGAILRGLDKLTGRSTDIAVMNGETATFGRVEITLGECRYPEGDQAGDAYAFLTIREAGEPEPVFRGWMIASSPALNALDHQRYDVRALRCTTA